MYKYLLIHKTVIHYKDKLYSGFNSRFMIIYYSFYKSFAALIKSAGVSISTPIYSVTTILIDIPFSK